MVFDGRMRVESVCLPVSNPAGGQSLLYGQRFADGPVSSQTPAIVLVHGIASSTGNWDFSPTWSVARALASAGYEVFSYDRLGYAKSSWYSQPGGGFMLTTQAHRSMLHDVVADVKTGAYGVSTSSDCSGSTTPGRTQSRRVVIIGHSAGGWIVAGHPGEYHDVAAMIQTDISGSAGGQPNAPIGNSSGGSLTPDPADYAYYKAHCGCDVTQLLLPNTAHLFMVHRSLASWVDHVVGLARGAQAERAAGASPSAPPAPTPPAPPPGAASSPPVLTRRGAYL